MVWGGVGRGGTGRDGVEVGWGGVGSRGEKKYRVPGMQEGRKRSACARFRRVVKPGVLNTSKGCGDNKA